MSDNDDWGSMSETTRIIIGVTLGFSMLMIIMCLVVIFERRRTRDINSQISEHLVE